MKMNTFGLILITIFTLIFIVFLDYFKLSKLDTFAVGQITDTYNKASVSRHYYKFILPNTNQFYTGNIEGTRFLDNEDELFLIGYQAENPKTNYLFLFLSIDSTLNLDSLNQFCSPQDFISWRNYVGLK